MVIKVCFGRRLVKLELKIVKNAIPMEVITETGEVTECIDTVLNKWCSEFGLLFKGTNVFSSDFSGLQCLLQLYSSLHLSD